MDVPFFFSQQRAQNVCIGKANRLFQSIFGTKFSSKITKSVEHYFHLVKMVGRRGDDNTTTYRSVKKGSSNFPHPVLCNSHKSSLYSHSIITSSTNYTISKIIDNSAKFKPTKHLADY